jgi:[acyl-carrier-protein] S-malonyltransferase
MSKTAFIFPGQGSQSVGMLLPAHEAWPQVADTFAEASDVLGFDLWQMACDGPAETLSLTANTQPLILTASVALFRAYRALGGPMPAVAAGHSLGEFSALVAANSLDFSDAVRLVRQRGEAMQVSVPVGVGAMAAIIGLDDDTINATCATISRSNEHVVLAVNYNSPGQVVIAGHSAAVEEAVVALKEAGAKRALPLPVSAPFHTPLMTHAGDVLREVLATTDLRDPLIPVISNVDAQAQQTASAIRDLLVQQVSAPVQWTGCVATMIDMGCERFVECGPGKVLSGLVKRIDKSKPCSVVETPDDMGTTLAELG